jgi:hypothetical protein
VSFGLRSKEFWFWCVMCAFEAITFVTYPTSLGVVRTTSVCCLASEFSLVVTGAVAELLTFEEGDSVAYDPYWLLQKVRS